MLCGGGPTRVSKETPATPCSALPHTGDRIGSSLRLGTDESSWLTRADVAVGAPQAIRNWVAQADSDEGRREDGLTTVEREELSRLRREEPPAQIGARHPLK